MSVDVRRVAGTEPVAPSCNDDPYAAFRGEQALGDGAQR